MTTTADDIDRSTASRKNDRSIDRSIDRWTDRGMPGCLLACLPTDMHIQEVRKYDDMTRAHTYVRIYMHTYMGRLTLLAVVMSSRLRQDHFV